MPNLKASQSPNVFTIRKSYNPEFTEQGKRRLAATIAATMKLEGLSIRSLAEKCVYKKYTRGRIQQKVLSHGTIQRYLQCSWINADESTFDAIAPNIRRAVHIEQTGDECTIHFGQNPNDYYKSGKDLMYIASSEYEKPTARVG